MEMLLCIRTKDFIRLYHQDDYGMVCWMTFFFPVIQWRIILQMKQEEP